MKNLYLLFLILLIGKGTAQDLQNANWVFSTFNTLQFPVLGSPAVGDVSTSAPGFVGHEGCASVSDKDGNLLLFSDGVRLWYRSGGTDNLLPVTLLGEPSSSQGVIFVPKPNFPDRYYIVTISGRSSMPMATPLPRLGLRYSEISLEGTSPVMVTTNAVLWNVGGTVAFDGTYLNVSEALTSARHSDGENYWVIAQMQHTAGSNWDGELLSFLVTEDGVGIDVGGNRTASQSLPLTLASFPGASPIAYTLKVSHTPGTGFDNFAMNTGYNGIYTGNFNHTTGAVTINTAAFESGPSARGYGLEFSPNGQYLYYTKGDEVRKISTADPVSSNTVYSQTMVQDPGAIQLSRDMQLYVSVDNQSSLSFITSPNSAATSNYVDNAIALNFNTSLGLPQWVWKQPCLPTWTTDTNLGANAIQYRERSQSIVATNDIGPTALAVYHAGLFVELNPEDPTNGITDGFEAQPGASFAAYIDICDSGFSYRPASLLAAGPVKKNPPAERKEQSGVAAAVIQVFPNPASSRLTVRSSALLKRISISSMDGKVMLDQSNQYNPDEIDISGFANGLYILKAETQEGKTFNKRFVKK